MYMFLSEFPVIFIKDKTPAHEHLGDSTLNRNKQSAGVQLS